LTHLFLSFIEDNLSFRDNKNIIVIIYIYNFVIRTKYFLSAQFRKETI